MRRQVLAVGAGALLGATFAIAQTPARSPRPHRTPAAAKSARPPLDFTGVWVLDAPHSRGVGPQMENAVLSVKQNGNRIWIEPIEQRKPNLLAEQIVVDGRKYEKTLGGNTKGTLVAAWAKDGQSLRMEVSAGTEEDPEAAVQRMEWRLEEGGKVWTRRTFQKDGNKQTYLVFRKRGDK